MNTEPEVVSSFFTTIKQESSEDVSDEFLYLIDELNASLEELKLPESVKCIYNSTIYARYTFEQYVRKYCNNKKHIMYFGTNPGPWGMSQTGVPFGEVNSVRDWLGIEGPVGKPPRELSARPVKGFATTRSEISGKRFWGLWREVCGEPENFFRTSFVYNYLPQQWMKENGCNLTPGDFKTSEMQELFNICDRIFAKVLELYDVKIIVTVGKFCEGRAQKVINRYFPSKSVQILYMPHPSPRSVNNNNWDQKAREVLNKLNLLQYYRRD